MKQLIKYIFIFTVVICFTGCGSKKIKAPDISSTFVNVSCDEVYDTFEKAGFSNITKKEIKDIGPDSTYSEESVESVSINGETDYSTDEQYDKEAEVVITYHSLAEYKVDIHVDFQSNLIFDKYDVDFIIDDDTQSTLKHGEDIDSQIVLTYGEHDLIFANSKNSSVNGKISLNVTSDLEAAYIINCHGEEVSVKEEYVDYKAELPDGKVKTTVSSDEYNYKNYKVVIDELKKMGFTNIVEDPLYDIVFGITEDGELESIKIGENSGFKRGEIFSSDSKVVVSYHTLQEKDPAVIAEKKKEEEEKKAEEAKRAEEEKQAEEARKAEEARLAEEEAKRIEEENKTLTVENCEELQQILSMHATSDPAYEEFVNKYEGKKIEFDGRVDYLVNNGNYKTRYDFLLSAGDYDPDTQIGPTFKFENVNFSELHSDLDSIQIGQNVHIIAIVDEFDSEHELFFLVPVSVTGR